MVSDPNVLN